MNNLLSVIVPVYNTETYLPRCINSLVNQTYHNLEIILINDASTDNCSQICNDFAIKDDRLIVIQSKKNGGISCARNKGLEIATGEYIAFIDSDDHVDTTMFEKIMAYVIEYDLEVMEIEHIGYKKNKRFTNEFKIEGPVEAAKRVLNNTSFAVWRKVFKSSLIKGMRFIPKLIHQDVFYTLDVYKNLSRIGHLDTPLYFYNTDNISTIRSKYTLKRIKTAIKATEYIVENINENPELFDTLNNYVTNYYTDHFFLLSRNTFIDPDKLYRKKLKKTIVKSFSFQNLTFRTLLVIVLPYKIMEIISSSYGFFLQRKF